MALGVQPSHTGWRGEGLLLSRRPYRLLVGGQVLGQGADGLLQITFAQILLFEIGPGATPWEIAKLLVVSLLPFSVVGPFAGVLIDRYNRRRVMVGVSLLRAAVVVAAVTILLVESQAAAYRVMISLLGCSRLVLAAKGAALPNTVGEGDLVTANAVSALAGPTVGFIGAVIGATFVEAVPAPGLFVCTAGYLGAAAVFARLPGVGGSGVMEPILVGIRRITAEMIDGVRFAAANAGVRRPLLAIAGNRALSGAGFIVLVLIADARYNLEASG